MYSIMSELRIIVKKGSREHGHMPIGRRERAKQGPDRCRPCGPSSHRLTAHLARGAVRLGAAVLDASSGIDSDSTQLLGQSLVWKVRMAVPPPCPNGI